jgi:hypothetical protein
VAIAVVVNGSIGGIEPTAPMAVLSMVAAVDGGGNDGIFTTPSHDKDHHICLHCHLPCPPLDEDWTVGWRAHCDAFHL